MSTLTQKAPEIRSYQQPKGENSFLPFYLPAGKSGKIEIKTEVVKAGTKMTVVSLRNSIFMGLQPANIWLENDTIVHTMTEKRRGTWMTTSPQEIEQHERQLRNAHGNVLVGGLGLGLAVAILQKNPKVKRIRVIEKNSDVIALVKPYLPQQKKLAIEFDDLFHHLGMMKTVGFKYDFAFYDIYQPTGQFMLNKYIMPLRKASIGIVPQDQIECWNEDEMIGQVKVGLENRLQIYEYGKDPEMKLTSLSDKEFDNGEVCNQESWPFWRWFRKKAIPKEVALQMTEQYCLDLKDAEKFHKWRTGNEPEKTPENG